MLIYIAIQSRLFNKLSEYARPLGSWLAAFNFFGFWSDYYFNLRSGC